MLRSLVAFVLVVGSSAFSVSAHSKTRGALSVRMADRDGERSEAAAFNRKVVPLAAGVFLAGKLFLDSTGSSMPEMPAAGRGPPRLAAAQEAKAASKKAYIEGEVARQAALTAKEQARRASLNTNNGAVFP